MGTRAKVHEYTSKARATVVIDAKLNAIADAIDALVEYIETLEHKIGNVETRVRRMSV